MLARPEIGPKPSVQVPGDLTLGPVPDPGGRAGAR